MHKHTSPNYYLALDQGGHSSRAIVFSDTGETVFKSKRAVSVQTLGDDKVEQNAQELSTSLYDVLADVSKEFCQHGERITSCGLATQRSNVVCWDNSTGKALSPAISWQDRRAFTWLNQFADQQDEIQQRTGLLLSAHYGASKLRWCLDHLPNVSQALSQNRLHMGPLASYLTAQLCGLRHHFVDPVNASRTLLWNLHDREWDKFLLKLFDIPVKPLPKCVPTIFNYGDIKINHHAVPLNVVSGDQSAALFAYGKPDIDAVYINLGTGAFLQCTTYTYIIRIPHLLSSIVFSDGRQASHVLECTVNGAGSALSKIEKELGVNTDYAEAQFSDWLEQFTNIPLFLNGVSGLGAPYWVPDFKSRFIGPGNSYEKIVAVAESILFLLQENLRLLSDYNIRIQRLVVTGGLAQTDALCQRLADISNLLVVKPQECEATARGTAFLSAQMPRKWASLTASEFTPQLNPPLQKRYLEWQSHMRDALQNYP